MNKPIQDRKIVGEFSLSYRDGETVSIRIADRTSGIEFVDLLISNHEFTRALSSLQNRPTIECEVRGLEYVGKKRVIEKRSIKCPLTTYDRKQLSAWLEANAQEDGWLVSTYLGSQGSVGTSNADGCVLNYSVTKFISEES